MQQPEEIEELTSKGMIVLPEIDVRPTGRVEQIRCLHPDHIFVDRREAKRLKNNGTEPGPWIAGPFDDVDSAVLAARAHLENAGHHTTFHEAFESKENSRSARFWTVLARLTLAMLVVIYAALGSDYFIVRLMHLGAICILAFTQGMNHERWRTHE